VESADDYVLIEDLFPATTDKESEAGKSANAQMPSNQRILNPEEKILDAVSQWNGARGRFVLRKKSSVSGINLIDPSIF